MMKYVDQRFQDHPHAYLSLEARMACGMGALLCLCCQTKGRTRAREQARLQRRSSV